MQSFSLNNKTITSNNSLLDLSDYLKLPDGWVFSYLQLDNTVYLTVPSKGKALVITDNLDNGYMYITPEYASWLYLKYM